MQYQEDLNEDQKERKGFLGGSHSNAMQENPGSIPGSGRSPGERNG